VSILNTVLGGLVDALLYPFRGLPPLVGLVVVSVLTSMAMLLVFRATSNQEGIEAVKRRIAAGVFEIRLFNDDPRTILRAQADILRHTLTYLGFTLVPVLWMIIPLVLLIIQLEFRYGYAGLEPAGTALVKVTVTAASASAVPDISLETDEGIEVESPLLWIPSLREANWRIAARDPGDHELRVLIGGEVFGKRVRVTDAVVRRAPVRPSNRMLDQLLYPTERPLPAGAPVESITVTYPGATIGVLWWEAHWIVIFFILTIVIAYALQRPFKVTL
jgi:hypothetical protein